MAKRMKCHLTNEFERPSKGSSNPPYSCHLPTGITLVNPEIHTWIIDEFQEKNCAAIPPFRAVKSNAEIIPSVLRGVCCLPTQGVALLDLRMDCIKELVSEQYFPRLGRIFADATRRAGGLNDKLPELVTLRDRRKIMQEQFDILAKALSAR